MLFHVGRKSWRLAFCIFAFVVFIIIPVMVIDSLDDVRKWLERQPSGNKKDEAKYVIGAFVLSVALAFVQHSNEQGDGGEVL